MTQHPPPNDHGRPPRENWGSKIGVIMAVAGSAVGLGNFLRFPGQAASNGGGIFMIPYFISLILVGIPVCWAEWTMGRYGGARGFNSAPGIFRVLWPRPVAKYIGVIALIIPVCIYMYYVYIEVWCLSYAIDFATGAMADVAASAAPGEDVKAYAVHFDTMVGMAENGFPGGRTMLLVLITFCLNFFLIYRGIAKGIEAFTKIAMPLLVLIAVIIVVRVLTLGTPNPAFPDRNIGNALGFMWNPRIESGEFWGLLLDPKIWLAASGQIFFSLSVGFGIILNYASYLRRDDDVVLSGLTSTSVNELCEVCLGGLMVVPLAFLFLDINQVGFSTFSLGFYTLPSVFHRMPFGDLFGFFFFLMLFIAALTSSLSMLQPAIAFLEEGFDLGRRLSVTFLAMIVSAGALIVVYFSQDLVALDTMDFWVGSFLIFVLAMIQTIIFGWVFGTTRGRREMMKGAEIKIPPFFWFVIKYVSPVYLIAIFVGFCWLNLPGYITAITEGKHRDIVLYVLAFLCAIAFFFGFLIHLAGRRWDRHAPLDQEDSLP